MRSNWVRMACVAAAAACVPGCVERGAQAPPARSVASAESTPPARVVEGPLEPFALEDVPALGPPKPGPPGDIADAAANGDVAATREFVSDGDDPGPPLLCAARGGWLDAVRVLLELGADPNWQSEDGHTALQSAVRDPNHTCPGSADPSHEIMALLLAHGAEVDLADDQGCTALHSASMTNDVESARVLLAHGADVNALGPGDTTPLGFALVRACHPDVAALLREHGGIQQGYGSPAG